MAKSKTMTTVGIIIGCALIVFGFKVYSDSVQGGVSGDKYAKVKGSKDAPLKITEFIDFQCPACAYGAQYLKQVMEEHPDLIQLKLKHFPLKMHQHGVLGARYAECSVEQGKFWQMYDLMLERQNNWKRLDDPREAFHVMAEQAQLDVGQLQSCVTSGRADSVIERNMQEGVSRKIRSTPTYFVNGEMVVGQKYLQIAIDNYLSEHGG